MKSHLKFTDLEPLYIPEWVILVFLQNYPPPTIVTISISSKSLINVVVQ